MSKIDSSLNFSTDTVFASPSDGTPGSGQLGLGLEETPFLDYELDADGEGALDFDFGEESMIGDLPGGDASQQDEFERHEKRKSVDGKDDDEGGGKRREGEDKTAKKPGRKPLTSEPTSVRVAIDNAVILS